MGNLAAQQWRDHTDEQPFPQRRARIGPVHALPGWLYRQLKVFKATFRGREGIYPSPYGELTAGGNKGYPVDHFHFNIQG